MKIFGRKTSFDPSDTDSVIAACRQNNPQAQHALIRMHYGFVMSICRRYASDALSAEEILNDSFLKVFTNLHKYDHHQPFKAWLRTIAVNTSIDFYRKHLRENEFTDREYADIEDLGEDAISRMSAEEILGMIQQLSPAYRMVFTLYVIDGYSHREIAEKLGIREGTSKSNLQDARHKLQAMLLEKNSQRKMLMNQKFTHQ